MGLNGLTMFDHVSNLCGQTAKDLAKPTGVGVLLLMGAWAVGKPLSTVAMWRASLTLLLCQLLKEVARRFMSSDGDRLPSLSGLGLPQPKLDCKVAHGRLDSGFEWGSSELQGWRPKMEDAMSALVSMPAPLAHMALFGVFDGHGGASVSQLVSRELPQIIAACVRGEVEVDSSEALNGPSAKLLERALHKAYLLMDDGLREAGSASEAPAEMPPIGEPGSPNNDFNLIGSTAVVALFDAGTAAPPASGGSSGSSKRFRRVTVANCGDSRAVLCRAGVMLPLSQDHKPELPEEQARIKNAGGSVARPAESPCHRIDGWGLNVSRSFGDFHYKARRELGPREQKVSALPDVVTLDLAENDEFLVLACDGIFELNTSEDVVNLVRAAFAKGLSSHEAAKQLVQRSCTKDPWNSNGQGMDNCSAIVINLGS